MFLALLLTGHTENGQKHGKQGCSDESAQFVSYDSDRAYTTVAIGTTISVSLFAI